MVDCCCRMGAKGFPVVGLQGVLLVSDWGQDLSHRSLDVDAEEKFSYLGEGIQDSSC
jgi:hypothetical protein